jgi:hypothetical protein
MALSLHTLPIEMLYRILDNLDNRTILLSCRNVCTRLNNIIDVYHRYQVILRFYYEVEVPSSSKRIALFMNIYIKFMVHIIKMGTWLTLIWEKKEFSGIHSLYFTDTNHTWFLFQSNRSARNETSGQCSRTKQSNTTRIAPFSIQPLTYYFIQTITTLNLSRNKIGLQGTKHLANALEQNKVRKFAPLYFSVNHSFILLQILTTLNLSHNKIGLQGAEFLVNALQQNRVIRLAPL